MTAANLIRVAATDLEVFPLCLGCNVFGWTVGQDQAFAVLDAFSGAGGNFFDTSDAYWKFIEGNSGGESETIIGEWMRRRGRGDRMVVSTKIGVLDGMTGGLTPPKIRRYVEGSLKRLGVETIDLLYAHADDPETPLEETLTGFDALVREGKVRYIAASRYTASRLSEAAAVAERENLASFVATQSLYSLVEREFETTHTAVVERLGLAVMPYYALAAGFLTGKYRPGSTPNSVRAEAEARPANPTLYLDDHGLALLAVLDDIAAAHHTTVAAVSLAWLIAQDFVTAPIASARTVAQLENILPTMELALSAEDVQRLRNAYPSPIPTPSTKRDQ
ncbi:aldo/keto reductase [Mycobacterium sp.]|uniref:aldo/keto reductase n=1 Tax=Mycobacterium sp. TaxID=1785 RepID=UPI003D1500A8